MLEGERIVAHGRYLVAVATQARGEGIVSPYVFFVDDGDEAGFRERHQTFYLSDAP